MERGGWVSRLWFHVAKRSEENYVEIYNLSISGGTSKTILERFEAEAKIRKADVLIFQTGGNDASYHEGHPETLMVSPEKFKSNIEGIIRRARKITDNILFLDLKNCDESKTTPVPWIPIYYTNENLKKYNNIMKEVCEDEKVHFLHIAPLNNDDFDDGLHPNARGHEKIFTQVKDFLTAQKWI